MHRPRHHLARRRHHSVTSTTLATTALVVHYHHRPRRPYYRVFIIATFALAATLATAFTRRRHLPRAVDSAPAAATATPAATTAFVLAPSVVGLRRIVCCTDLALPMCAVA